MRVTFPRLPDGQRAYAVVERDDGVVYRLDGGIMGSALPHDLRHFVAERELRITDGIWGSIAAGTVYTSMEHLRGRRPPHAADRSAALKRAFRNRIMLAELLANLVEAVAALDDPTEANIARLTAVRLAVVPVPVALPTPVSIAAAARTLQVEAARWARLRPGAELRYEWPSWQTPKSIPRPRDPSDRHDPRRDKRLIGFTPTTFMPAHRVHHGAGLGTMRSWVTMCLEWTWT